MNARSWGDNVLLARLRSRALVNGGLTGAGQIRYGPAMHPSEPLHSFPTHSDEFWTGERLYITEIINHAACPDVSLALGRIEPGVTTQIHSLDVAETYCVKSGEGVIEIDGQSLALRPGDSITIAPGQAQRITNRGADDVLVYLVCRPRFTPDSYHNLEDTP